MTSRRQLIRVAQMTRRFLPIVLVVLIAIPALPKRIRAGAAVLLVLLWLVVYAHYRRSGLRQSRHEFELMRRTSWDAFWRHYNERVPTIEQEYAIWGPYHAHRHDMRYDIVAQAVRQHVPSGGRVLDLGCGSANVADRLSDLTLDYVGFDFGGPHIRYAQQKYAGRAGTMRTAFVRGDGEHLPFERASMDLVVMSEVIEHLLRPELAVWEISRVLKPGGAFVMTTNNASEVPLRSPLSHLPAWLEKMAGATFPSLISSRPWVWPEKVDAALLPEGSPDVYVPHTHHIAAQTRRLFAAAGMDTVRWATFEFPPPQSRTAAWLEGHGERGLRLVDALERIARSLPGIRRLGTHLFIVSRKAREPIAPAPPPDVWPGPLSDGAGVSGFDRTPARR